MSLQMTGAMVVRGDAAFGKALTRPEKQLVGLTAGALGVGALAQTPPAKDMRRKAKVSSLLYRSGNPEYRALDRSQKKAYVDRLVNGPVAKREKRDYSGTAVGAGSVIGTTGLIGGGVPGARPNSGRLAQVKYGTKYEATRHLVSATRGGVFGYRQDAHQSFLNRQNADEKAHGGKKTTRTNHYLRGQGTGKIAPEKTIIRHMHRGRVASNAALVGGAGLVALGIRARDRKVGKRDDYKADVAIGAGGTTAALGAGGSLAMNRQGRKWASRSAASLDAARKINPKLGGYDVKRTGRRVPDVAPHAGTSAHIADKRVFAGRSSKDTEAAGRLRGAAGQQRYFARVYGNMARHSRKVAGAGALVGSAGLGAKYLQLKPREVAKASRYMGGLYDDVAHGNVHTAGVRDSGATRVRVVPREKLVKVVVHSLSRKQKLAGAGAAAGIGAAGFAAGRVKKSYIPGKGYVPASKVPVKQLRELAHGGRAKAQYQSYLKDNEHKAKFAEHTRNTKAFVDSQSGQGASSRRRLRPRYLTNKTVSQVASKETAAFAVKTGSRRDPGHVFARGNASPSTLAHEHAHVSPKRSGYRLFQLQSSPRKIMREEGRADYLGGTHYKHSPGDSGYAEAANSGEDMRAAYQDLMGPKFRRSSVANYRHVQDKMRYAGTKSKVGKVATTMSDREAASLARRYDTRGPLPKGLDRPSKMKAYEARYIASGGKKGERWKRRADAAEVGRNVGLAGATLSAAALLAGRGKRTGPVIARTKGLRRVTAHQTETAGLAAAAGGGASELYGEHARNRRASYANSPAGVAGSALTRMQNYTPKARS